MSEPTPPIPTLAPNFNDIQLLNSYNALLSAINSYNLDLYDYNNCQLKTQYNCGVVPSVTIKNNMNSIQAANYNQQNRVLTIPDLTRQKFQLSNNFMDSNLYTSDLTNVKKYHEDIKKLRAELDIKLNALYQTNHSLLADYKYEYDTSIYTGILWTILASSVLYYVFTKM
jgi:hypothetical protein